MRQELEVLQCIYPELSLSDESHGSIDISHELENPVECRFKSLPSFEVDYLPPLRLTFTLPAEYPAKAPVITLQCPWLGDHLRKLQAEVQPLIIDECLFDIIDYIKDASTRAYELQKLDLPDSFYPALSTFQRHAQQEKFDAGSYECQICMDSKLGTQCVALTCHHVFCQQCLHDMLSLHINEGSLAAIKCPSCPAKTSDRIALTTLKRIVTGEQFTRYTKLLRKQEIESLPNNTYCPRERCAAVLARDPDEKLVICTECEYAFCADCRRTWHGPGEPCRRITLSSTLATTYQTAIDAHDQKEQIKLERLYGRKNLLRLVAELEDNKLADSWRRENAQMCPSCTSYVEKSMGCNHMICSICNKHFCFLCGEGLSSRNPYSHYSDKGLSCYGKLFEGLTGLEDPFADFIV